jgi:hypothetical protein
MTRLEKKRNLDKNAEKSEQVTIDEDVKYGIRPKKKRRKTEIQHGKMIIMVLGKAVVSP